MLRVRSRVRSPDRDFLSTINMLQLQLTTEIADCRVSKFKIGDFCCIENENGPIECVVHSIKNGLAVLISIGLNEKFQVPIKDLRPSYGIDIQLKQEFKASAH